MVKSDPFALLRRAEEQQRLAAKAKVPGSKERFLEGAALDMAKAKEIIQEKSDKQTTAKPDKKLTKKGFKFPKLSTGGTVKAPKFKFSGKGSGRIQLDSLDKKLFGLK